MARVRPSEPIRAEPSCSAPHADQRGGVRLPVAAAQSRRGLLGRGRGGESSGRAARRECETTPAPPAAGAVRERGSGSTGGVWPPFFTSVDVATVSAPQCTLLQVARYFGYRGWLTGALS